MTRRAFAGPTTAPFQRSSEIRCGRRDPSAGRPRDTGCLAAFLSHLVVEALGHWGCLPKVSLFSQGRCWQSDTQNAAEAATARWGTQDGQVADDRRRLSLRGSSTAASGTHDGVLSACEMEHKLCGAKHQINDANFWEIEKRFDTMDIHAQVPPSGLGFPRISRGILCLSMSEAQPLLSTSDAASDLAKSP